MELSSSACIPLSPPPPPILPLELFPLILSHLQSPCHLRSASLVSRAFNRFANEILYQHCWVKPWEKGAEAKLPLLFDTLGRVPELSKLVHKLEVRSYPPPTNLPPSLASTTLLTLLSLPNITSLSWTRDRSLSTALLAVISSCMPNLRELELNAHSAGVFEPEGLLKIEGLKKLGLIMPDRGVVGLLGRWFEILKKKGGGLERLSIIAQSSPLITDELLIPAAPSLSNLTQLSLTSLTKVSTATILLLLATSSSSQEDSRASRHQRGITHLALEHLPRVSLSEIHVAFPSLSLHGFTYLSLTYPIPTSDPSDANIVSDYLHPHQETLRTLHLSTPVPKFPSTHFVLPPLGLPNLTLLSLHSPIFLKMDSDLPSLLPNLTWLFLPVQGHLWSRFLDVVGSGSWKRSLRTIHIVSPHPGAEGRGAWEPGMIELGELAKKAKGLKQVGFRTRCYDVHRFEEIDTDYWSKDVGKTKERVELVRFDTELGGRVPDVFQLGRFLG